MTLRLRTEMERLPSAMGNAEAGCKAAGFGVFGSIGFGALTFFFGL